jgi:uncharacterized membrane protein
MSGEELRIRSLERRIDRLERRIKRLEPDDVTRATTAAAAAAPAGPPAPPAPPAPPPVAVPPAAPAPARAIAWGTPRTWAEPPGETTPTTAAASARPAWAPETAAHRPAISLRDLEERFAGRAMAWVGGFALVAAAVFFLSLAFSRGWINQPMRVLIGLAVGMAAFGAGGFLLARANRLMGNVLTAVGLGIFSIALLAATRLYGLVVPEIGLAGALVAAVAAAALAVRFDAREVAVFGLIAALVAPPVVGASPNLLTLGFVAVTLVGTTAIALFRSWRWLPAIAFLLAAPQLASWLAGDPEPSQALVALAGFWLVNIVAAAGEEVRIRRDDLRPSSATLVLVNGVFLLWAGFVVLAGDLEPWRGTFIATASLAHLLVGGWFLGRQGLEHLFGNLVAGTGVALLAIAAFVQLGAPAVPVAWAAEAVALAWLAVRRRHRWSAAAAIVLGALAVGHLLAVEYPLRDAGIPALSTFEPAFLHPAAASLGAVLLAIAVAVGVVPIRWVRSLLAGGAIVLAAYAVTFEVTGPALAAALTLLALGGLVLDRLVERLPADTSLVPVAGWTTFGWSASIGGIVAGLMAVALLLSTEFPPRRLGDIAATPFLHAEVASLAIVLAGLVGGGVLVAVRWVRSLLAGIGLLLVAWAFGFEVTGPTLVGLLVLLLPAGIIIDRALGWLPDDPRFAPLADATEFASFSTVAGAAAWVAAAAYALSRYLDPTGWGSVTPPAVPFSDERALVAALLVAAALAAARWLGPGMFRRAALVAAVVAAAWVVPFEVYADVVVVLWVALAAVAVAVARWDRAGTAVLTGLAVILAGGAAFVALVIVASPDRLWVVDPTVVGRAPLLAGWPLAFVALAVALGLAPRLSVFAAWRPWFQLAAGAAGVFLVSVAVVDAFQRMTGGSVAVEELAKQAQVALSVAWTGIGAATLVAGLAGRRPMLRHAGFALLGLATVKVFVIDLAALDVAYRALVLGGLGVLLLLSAYLFTHFRGPRAGASGVSGGARPAG